MIMCPTCKAPVWTHQDKPLTIGRFTTKHHPMIVKCARCTDSFKVTAGAFHRMPEVNVVK